MRILRAARFFFSGSRAGEDRAAETSQRAHVAFRSPRYADERPEIDQGRIESPRVACRQERVRQAPELLLARGRIYRDLQVHQAREQASDVCLDNWDRLVEGERCYGVSGVATEPRQLARIFRRGRKDARVFADDSLRRGVQISRASVIAKALPGVEHIRFGSRGQGLEIRKTTEPCTIIRNHRRDLGLL